MGAIQNSINSMIGTVGALAGAKVKMDENQAIQAEVARNQALDIANEIPALENEKKDLALRQTHVEANEKALNDIANTLDINSSAKDLQAFSELSEEVDKDRKMADFAIKTYEGKVKAKTLQLQRLQKVIKRANGLRGI